jgi:hypothetical protein
LCGGLAVPMLILAALGTRSGLVPMPALMTALAAGFVLALLAFGIAISALIDVWNSGVEGGGSAVAGIVYALPALGLLGLIAAAAIVYPRLTDVTTNPVDELEFAGAFAPQHTPSREDIALQREAYPDLVTHNYPLPLGEVYAAARGIVEDRGWTIVRDSRPTVMPKLRTEIATARVGETDEIVRALALKSVMSQSRGVPADQEPGAGAIGALLMRDMGNVATLEATARTPVFGFRDIVVVRLRGSPEGTEVDMRSASEFGEHDLGQNARRIRAFLAKLDSVLQLDPGASTASGVVSTGQ